MSLTRSFLKGMGLSAEQESAIIEEHIETVNALKEQRDNYKADADKLADLQMQLNEANDKLKGFEADDGTWQAKYEKEHNDFESYKAAQEEATSLRTKTEAYVSALKETGISEKAINLILDSSKTKEAIKALEFDENGSIKELDALKTGLKEEFSGFITSVEGSGARTITPPASMGSDGKRSKEEIMAIKDTTERQKAIAENPEVFGL